MDTILVIDLDKFKSVLFWYEPDARSASFRSIAITPAILPGEMGQAAAGFVVVDACSQAGCTICA